ncbi:MULTISPECIES: flagellar export protein FliJ [Halomonadaceae]|jgi:flagellar FliJ protein|uniref:Flagellar FliJ protein n=1 Tax=Onishia taeanensis TaxID=284577 RepID=A0A328XZH9_9GAMM|nr:MULTISPECIES: flagellar export protein FliJ [Halomonas]MDI4637810.1 flagella biosynthesis chaperone FliJ [Halomonas sp. BMC7]NUJ58832.1 flagella biosynthesis chaperone FliJ [Halomonas taeanensis]RAR64603.1 flagellar FliJ protein [Halomonas taeanensis]|tara:strand:+ start:4594 stop:5052 length:459 start_codon:yes stop_codon:yes gene_type:complete
MSASLPLDTLTELAREARDAAGQTLANERRSQQQAATQLDTLRRYRLEYATRLQNAMHNGIDPATLHNYQQFLASLDAAVDRARAALEDHSQRVEGCQQHWREEQKRLTSYDTLANRRQEKARRLEQRQEQRHNDEMSSNSLLRRTPDDRGL